MPVAVVQTWRHRGCCKMHFQPYSFFRGKAVQQPQHRWHGSALTHSGGNHGTNTHSEGTGRIVQMSGQTTCSEFNMPIHMDSIHFSHTLCAQLWCIQGVVHICNALLSQQCSTTTRSTAHIVPVVQTRSAVQSLYYLQCVHHAIDCWRAVILCGWLYSTNSSLPRLRRESVEQCHRRCLLPSTLHLGNCSSWHQLLLHLLVTVIAMPCKTTCCDFEQREDPPQDHLEDC